MVETLIHITDHQTDQILDDISEDNFWLDSHDKTMENNVETFKFITFTDKSYSQYLTNQNRIIIPDEDNKLIEFYILNVRKSDHNGIPNCEVLSVASYSTLKTAKVIRPQTTNALSAVDHAKNALSGTEWSVGTVSFDGVRTFTFDNYTNPYAYLNRIANEFGLELHFRVESNGYKITRRYVDLLKTTREWHGREVEFGKDLQSIERIEDSSNIVTALIGLGPDRDDGTRLEVFVQDEEALQRWGRNGQHIIDTYEPLSDNQDMTEERLRTLTEGELSKRVNSIVQYKAEVIDLENIPGLEHEKFRFGETIRIKDLKFNPPLYLEARIHSISRSIKAKGRKTVELGDFIEYTEEEIFGAVRRIERELGKRITFSQFENTAVLLGKQYNGAMFTESGGFESIRNDGLVRVIGNSIVGFAIQKRDTVESPWIDQVYVDTNGNAVYAGGVNGVTGTFGQVSVKNGDLLLEDEVSGTKTVIRENSNMIYDHSFEYVKPHTSVFRVGNAASVFTVDPASLSTVWGNWNNTKPTDARIMVSFEGGTHTLYGQRAVVLRGLDFGVWDQHIMIPEQIKQTKALSFSAYVAPYEQTTYNVTVSLRLQLVNSSGQWIRDLVTRNVVIDYTKKYNWTRIYATFLGDLQANEGDMIRARLFLENNTTSAMILCDGVQVVPFAHPAFYYPETALFRFINGYDKAELIDSRTISSEYASTQEMYVAGQTRTESLYLNDISPTVAPAAKEGVLWFGEGWQGKGLYIYSTANGWRRLRELGIN